MEELTGIEWGLGYAVLSAFSLFVSYFMASASKGSSGFASFAGRKISNYFFFSGVAMFFFGMTTNPIGDESINELFMTLSALTMLFGGIDFFYNFKKIIWINAIFARFVKNY